MTGASDLERPVAFQIAARVARGDYEDWATQVAATGGCVRPVRLSGTHTTIDTSTGEVVRVFDTDTQPDGILLKACGARRATTCPACAAVYRSDARALILAGLPDHHDTPVLFLTLTAPSFGPVHTDRPDQQPCHPPTVAFSPTPHPHHCPDNHQPHDDIVGTPICDDCYGWDGTIIFNNRATELWRRTMIATRRNLGKALGLPARTVEQAYSVAYIKIAEYQTRGAVHFHALVRVDPHTDAPNLPAGTLETALRAAASSTAAPNPHLPDRPVTWGPQLDIQHIPTEDRPRIAGYIAKYATKSIDTNGVLDHQLHHGQLDHTPLPTHLQHLVQTAWTLGEEPGLAAYNLQRWAHTLGYRGHWLTKSRTWSTTLTALRQRRHQWQLTQHGHPPQPHHTTQTDLTYQSTGHHTQGDQWLAHTHHTNHQLNRHTAWEEQ